MKVNLDSPGDDVRIEIIPLIDVIFCVLTFFILAAVSLTRQSGINVDLPSAASGTTQMREMLVVSIDPIGQTYIEQQPVTRDQLYQVLADYHQQRPDGLMVLYASRSASYNDVVEVLDLLRQAGGDQVALATLPESGVGESTPGLEFDFNDPTGGAYDDPFGSPTPVNPFDLNNLDPNTFPGLESPSDFPGNDSTDPNAPLTPSP